jgi:hypothetical protein
MDGNGSFLFVRMIGERLDAVDPLCRRLRVLGRSERVCGCGEGLGRRLPR